MARPGDFSTVTIEDTSATALVVGGTPGSATGTGGVNAGTVKGNTSVSDSTGTLDTVRKGGITLASQAAYDVMYATSSTQWGRVANGVTGQVLAATTNGAPVWAYGPVQLYKNSGTNTSAAAANVDTYAISGLTANDRLQVYWRLESQTQATAGPVMLYSATDSATITNLIAASGGVGAGAAFSGSMVLTPSAVNPNMVQGQGTNVTFSSGTMSNFASAAPTLATSWTSSWTLALRHSGVTAGGTLYWEWLIVKIPG